MNFVEVLYQRWMTRKKVIQDVPTSIRVLDGYNKTLFVKEENQDKETLIKAARKAHEDGEVYFATFLRNSIPFCHLESNKAYFRITFLDELQRDYLIYDFVGKFSKIDWRSNIPEDKLFLSKVTYKTFQTESDKQIRTESAIFKPDGRLHVTEIDSKTNERIDKEAKKPADVSDHWVDYPDFGSYDQLIQKEITSRQVF